MRNQILLDLYFYMIQMKDSDVLWNWQLKTATKSWLINKEKVG